MTERLYYTDAYLAEFEAAVVERTDDGRRIYLDRTAFYPTSGGQPFDTGTLAGIRVVDVVDDGDRIAHVLDAPLEPSRDSVHGIIDRERRFDHMQQHTGQHVLSALLADGFDRATVSVHFGPEVSTLDVDSETVDAEVLRDVERRANQVVLEDHPVAIVFEDAAAARGLRKPTGREGRIRIIEIPGLDRSACGGTHVRRTAEIGPILVRGVERVRRESRIGFVCGWRALARAHEDHAALARTARTLSAGIDEVPALVDAQIERLKDAERAHRQLAGELSGHRARALHERTPANDAGLRVAIEHVNTDAAEELRALAHAYAELPRAALIGLVQGTGTVLLAVSADSGFEAGTTLREALARHAGRGGGSARIAQGAVKDTEIAGRVAEALRERLERTA